MNTFSSGNVDLFRECGRWDAEDSYVGTSYLPIRNNTPFGDYNKQISQWSSEFAIWQREEQHPQCLYTVESVYCINDKS